MFDLFGAVLLALLPFAIIAILFIVRMGPILRRAQEEHARQTEEYISLRREQNRIFYEIEAKLAEIINRR